MSKSATFFNYTPSLISQARQSHMFMYFCVRNIYDHLRSLDFTYWNGHLFSCVWVLRNLFWFIGCGMYLPPHWSQKVQLRSWIHVDYHGCRVDTGRTCCRFVEENHFNRQFIMLYSHQGNLFYGLKLVLNLDTESIF